MYGIEPSDVYLNNPLFKSLVKLALRQAKRREQLTPEHQMLLDSVLKLRDRIDPDPRKY